VIVVWMRKEQGEGRMCHNKTIMSQDDFFEYSYARVLVKTPPIRLYTRL